MAINLGKKDTAATKSEDFTTQLAALEGALKSAAESAKQIAQLDAAETALAWARGEAEYRGDTAAALKAHDDLELLKAANVRKRIELRSGQQGAVGHAWKDLWPPLVKALRLYTGVMGARFSAMCDGIDAEREALNRREESIRGQLQQISQMGGQTHHLESVADRTTLEGASAFMAEHLGEVQSWVSLATRTEAQEKKGG